MTEIAAEHPPRPVARLVPAVGDDDAARIAGALETLKRLRQGATLDDLAWAGMRGEGRR
jgi:hypothetical protein